MERRKFAHQRYPKVEGLSVLFFALLVAANSRRNGRNIQLWHDRLEQILLLISSQMNHSPWFNPGKPRSGGAFLSCLATPQ